MSGTSGTAIDFTVSYPIAFDDQPDGPSPSTSTLVMNQDYTVRLNDYPSDVSTTTFTTDGDYAAGTSEVWKNDSGVCGAGKIYYLDSSQEWQLADADTEAESKGLLGITLGSDFSDGVLLRGMIRAYFLVDNTLGDIGDPIWLSPLSAGYPTITKPTSSGKAVRSLGWWIGGIGANPILMFQPSSTYIMLD